jgi:hypothetical protein
LLDRMMCFEAGSPYLQFTVPQEMTFDRERPKQQLRLDRTPV